MRRRRWPFHAPALTASLGWVANCGAKRIEGQATLAPGQALVVSKFCFDFNPDCSEASCGMGQEPGVLTSEFFGARLLGRNGAAQTGNDAEVYLALLDDEYFSFPEVSQVWSEANCSDVLKAAKRSFKVDWAQASKPSSVGAALTTHIIEKLRPRWWYITLAACSTTGAELSYRMHFENPLRGAERELSMDAMGVRAMTALLCALFGVLMAAQLRSFPEWRGRGGRAARRCQVHPMPLLVTAAAAAAALGEVAWFAYYWHYQATGQSHDLVAFVGRVGVAASKTMLSMMLMLMAHGVCVCTSDVPWFEHRELLVGIAVFGCISLAMEAWGESEFRTTTTEYIYDTRAGTALVACDLLWLWFFVSRSWRTFQAETRARPKIFYRTYAPIFALWFATLPLVALLASVLAPWVRFFVTHGVNGLAHVVTLGALVYTFRPSVARELYEVKLSEYEAINDEEMDRMLHADDDEL